MVYLNEQLKPNNMKKQCLAFYLLALTCLLAVGQENHTITFNIDMNATFPNLKDSILNLGIRGSVAPLSWVRGIKLKDTDKNGIYTATVEFKKHNKSEVLFKYVLNEVEWESGNARTIALKSTTTDVFTADFRYQKKNENPFKKFIGKWTLKNDLWMQGATASAIDTLYLPDHYSTCKEINTGKSLLWIVDATSARGHALWTYNAVTKEVFAQSSFYPDRIGLGSGTVTAAGDIALKISFEGNEPEGTYRKYSYEWVNEDEYILKSYQYDHKDQPTGNFYGGTFSRIKNEQK